MSPSLDEENRAAPADADAQQDGRHDVNDQQQSRPCTSVGPYYPDGDTEWTCRAHGRVELDRDPRFDGQEVSAGGWSCPVSGQAVQVPSARTLFKRAKKKRHQENVRRRRAEVAARTAASARQARCAW